MKRKLFLLFLLVNLFFLESCQSYVARAVFPKKSRPEGEFPVDKDASPEFKMGWRDGCETGMSGGSNTFYHMFYRNNQADGYKMMESSDYRRAWSASFWYCYRYDWIRQRSPIWESFFTGYR